MSDSSEKQDGGTGGAKSPTASMIQLGSMVLPSPEPESKADQALPHADTLEAAITDGSAPPVEATNEPPLPIRPRHIAIAAGAAVGLVGVAGSGIAAATMLGEQTAASGAADDVTAQAPARVVTTVARQAAATHAELRPEVAPVTPPVTHHATSNASASPHMTPIASPAAPHTAASEHGGHQPYKHHHKDSWLAAHYDPHGSAHHASHGHAASHASAHHPSSVESSHAPIAHATAASAAAHVAHHPAQHEPEVSGWATHKDDSPALDGSDAHHDDQHHEVAYASHDGLAGDPSHGFAEAVHAAPADLFAVVSEALSPSHAEEIASTFEEPHNYELPHSDESAHRYDVDQHTSDHDSGYTYEDHTSHVEDSMNSHESQIHDAFDPFASHDDHEI